MILRRIAQHVKNENWFAVTLDFIIVVIGVAVAMMGQQWLNERDQRSDLARAEQALQKDLFRNYFNAKERIAVSACRIQAYQSISLKLLESGDEWVAMPRTNNEKDEVVLITALPNLLRSPSRPWGSNIWTAELNRGTFNTMDIDRRSMTAMLFKQTNHAQQLQRDIYTLQGQMKTLAFSTRIGQSERLQYLNKLGELDIKSGMLELSASQIITNIEAIGVDRTDEVINRIKENMPSYNERAKSIYGECFVPITMENLTKQVKLDKQQ